MLDLSVIVVSYNTKDLLLQCLQSVIDSLEDALTAGRSSIDARSISHGYEVLVVDNASADGSAFAVGRRFPEVRLIENEFNRGFAAANNQAIEISQGRRILYLNPDTVVHGNAITELMRFLDRYPRTAAVTGKLFYANGDFQHSAFHFPGLWMTFLDLFPLHHRLQHSRLNGRYSPQDYLRRPFEIDYPLGACMMMRREALDRVGPFSEDFFMYCEEIDWCLRAKRDRWLVYCQPAAEITHYGGQSTAQLPDMMFVELYRSRLRLFKKYYNPFYRVVAKGVIALGLWWEHGRALQRYLNGEITPLQYVARQHACRRVFGLLRADQ